MSLFLPSRTAMSRSPFCSWLGIAAGVPPAGKAFDFRRYFFFLPFFFFFFVTLPFFILIDVRFCRLFIHPGPRLGSLRFRWVAVARGFFRLFSGHLLFLRFSGFSLPFYLMLADETTRLGWLDASRRFFFSLFNSPASCSKILLRFVSFPCAVFQLFPLLSTLGVAFCSMEKGVQKSKRTK